MMHSTTDIDIRQSYLILTAYLVPFFMAVSMVLALHLRKNKNKALKMLVVTLLSVTGTVLLYILKFFFFYSLSEYPVLQIFNQLYGVAVAPFIYLYFVALLRPGKLSLRMAAKHFIPFSIWFIAVMVLYLSGNASQPYFSTSSLLRDVALPANVVRIGMLTTFIVVRFGYIIAILVMLLKYRRSIKTQFSYTEGINLNWAYWTLLVVPLYSFSPMMVSVLSNIHFPTQLAFAFVSTIYIATLFFTGYYQPTLYADEDKEGYEATEAKRLLGLSSDSQERLKSDLVSLFETKKRFQSPTLSIDDVAKDLNTNRTYVSRIINEEFGASFYGFVNRHRMMEFIKRVDESKDYASFKRKIGEVSEQVGFKSYSSFYHYFKDEMGITPSEYLRQRNRRSNTVNE